MRLSRISQGCLVCLALAALPLASQQTADSLPHGGRGQHASPSPKALDGDERVLHALNRFTFGPRPGDLERVRETGLDRWFELQLHPATLDFTELDRRLNEFPAMRLSTPQLLMAFPSGAIIRQAADGKFPVPTSPILRIIYNDQIAYEKGREAKTRRKRPMRQRRRDRRKKLRRRRCRHPPRPPWALKQRGQWSRQMRRWQPKRRTRVSPPTKQRCQPSLRCRRSSGSRGCLQCPRKSWRAFVRD